ncbi:MAG TPA: flagellar FlbD family protein [bacterium]|nr:flagellar FlbD family protein [bacterium]
MISLQHLNGSEFTLNADLIQQIEETPDTKIVLTNGKEVLVKQPRADVVARVIAYKRQLRTPAPLGGDG